MRLRTLVPAGLLALVVAAAPLSASGAEESEGPPAPEPNRLERILETAWARSSVLPPCNNAPAPDQLKIESVSLLSFGRGQSEQVAIELSIGRYAVVRAADRTMVTLNFGGNLTILRTGEEFEVTQEAFGGTAAQASVLDDGKVILFLPSRLESRKSGARVPSYGVLMIHLVRGNEDQPFVVEKVRLGFTAFMASRYGSTSTIEDLFKGWKPDPENAPYALVY